MMHDASKNIKRLSNVKVVSSCFLGRDKLYTVLIHWFIYLGKRILTTEALIVRIG